MTRTFPPSVCLKATASLVATDEQVKSSLSRIFSATWQDASEQNLSIPEGVNICHTGECDIVYSIGFLVPRKACVPCRGSSYPSVILVLCFYSLHPMIGL